MEISGSVVFVTGGSSGLGSNIVTHFANKGAKVAIFDRKAPTTASNPSITFYECDVTNDASV
jgi:NAD(P)-dependent dehydrogenase (short-subunit alcohol dehydrogenase family)